MEEEIKEIKKVLATIINHLTLYGEISLSYDMRDELQQIAKKWIDESK